MAFDAEHGFADTEHGDLAMLALPEDHAIRGQTLDLVLMHVLEPAARLRRLHPGFLPQDRHVENANAPALSGALHLSAQGLGQHLVAEADADERLAQLVQPLQEAGEAANPAERIVDRELRPGAKVRIAGIGRRRQAAVASIVVGEAKPGRVRTEQRCEHLAVPAGDAGKTPRDVIAFEQADVHYRVNRKWKDLGRVKLSSPSRDSVQPRPESFTPVQASAGSR